ncbi:cytosolic carboxypeptidase 2-like isoform X28 [Pomacea canaliculata]|uniref:cytosolic carboxypeptidase 2-like isoform X28 n=1 Tax=Pomacea canaliculata TaxID=400727 RepID=UPI000D7307F0|nr:cytosolic carboxypeptidase 2-like isoform X28 [Pomacea canaliculata]
MFLLLLWAPRRVTRNKMKMWLEEEQTGEQDYYANPYESFIKRHLKNSYGYFTGKNQNYRNGFQQYKEWEKTFAFGEGSSSSEECDLDSDDEKSAIDHILEDSLALQQESEHDPVSYEDNRQEDIRTTQVIYSCESGRMVPRLREPRNLYALNKELGPQQAARWPSEIQVLKDRISHLYYVPPEPEPCYKPTGMERTPMCRGEEGGGKVVFEYDPKLRCNWIRVLALAETQRQVFLNKSNMLEWTAVHHDEGENYQFMRSCVGGSRNGTSKCAVELESENDTTLIFESRFESGNLAKAVKVGDYEYELWLRYDLYTDKHTQWFYFSFSNTRPNVQYRFTIVNLLKPDSLYNNGMRPLMYSDKEANLKKVGWIRGGQDIKYYRNNLRYMTSKGEKSYFSLTWTAVLAHENDTVYWAHCYPYTYTDLQDYLMELQNDPAKSRICKQRILCRSLAGNLVYILTISSPSQNLEDMKHKKAVVITSRVHPGESNSSWMMKGLLDYLTGNSPDAKLLRDTFIFKIIPMLNPDGVIVGNYRCSLAGRDLNRQYKSVLKYAYPCVVHTRNMIRKLLQERDIIVYCDLHGHSRRQNVFIYGCEQRFGSNRRLHERIFPCMLHKNAPDKFSFDSCKFKVQKIKEGTGRVVMWNMGIMNSYTMEATFCGSSLGRKKGFHFSVADFEAMGYHFCDTLLDYCDPDNTKYAKILENLENRMKMAILAKLGRDSANDINLDDIQLSDYNFGDVESSDMGSNSSDSDGPPIHMQYQAERMKKKKKKLKSRKDRDKGRLSGAEESKKPVAAPQIVEEKSSKPNSEQVSKQSKQQDYLEALASTYVQHGFPIDKEPVFVKMEPKKAPVMDGLTTLTPLDEFVRSQIIPSQSISPLERRPPSKPHLLEVSAAQQRQQDTIREAGSMQNHANVISRTQEHKSGSSGKNQYPRTQVPYATAVGYKGSTSSSIFAQPMSLQGQATADYLPAQAESIGGRHVQSSHSQRHNQGGRKSRCGMRDDDEEENDGTLKPHTLGSSLFNDLDSNLTKRPPRIKPAHTSQEMADAVAGIRKLQQSLQQHPHATAATVTSATGTYIHQLIKETGDDIQDLTNEIQEKIENKLQEMRELQHHQVSATAPNKTEKTLMRAKAEGQKMNIQGTGEKSIAADLKQQTILASTQHAAKSGKNPSVHTLKQEELVETFSILPPHLGESRKREGSAHSSSNRDEFALLPGIEAGEMMPRVKSARSCRQVVEAIPTKISLMICSDHKDGGDNTPKAQQFLPLYRSVRAPFFRNYTRRK